MKAIYEPSGPAREYSPLACNLFRGCLHQCAYCYVPACLRISREEFHREVTPRPGILEALRKEAPQYAGGDREVMFCFTCDPYPEVGSELTREALQILTAHDVPVQVLTKAGERAERDFDLLARMRARFGVTLVFSEEADRQRWEPGAAPLAARQLSSQQRRRRMRAYMTFAELFAGIGAASVAWEPLGWQCEWASEVDPFASAVFAYHHGALNLGDIHGITRTIAKPVDVLVGGPPCQDFSIAGKRAGMGGARGALVWEYLRLVEELQPRWFVFENVPGLLSSDGGRAFGTLLGEVGKRGYGWAYRILDAQYFGVPQWRRRVYLVGCAGGAWQRAAAVLFESASLRGYSAPRRETGEGTSRHLAGCAGSCSQGERKWYPPFAFALNAKGGSGRMDAESETFIPAKQVQWASGGGQMVRRLTPRECERLQGFPDDYTLIPWRGRPREACPDGPRYRCLGNAFPVPVMRWIGERIQMVNEL